jgi:predicted RNA-binding Zn-ribbon protein involved in translation (DUF1610 family)
VHRSVVYRVLREAAMGRGVSCSKCGASTPLPEDLRTSTFKCAYCGETLVTAAYAGASAVSADAMRGYLLDVVKEGRAPETPGAHPRFEQHNTETRRATCKHCGGAIEVPLDLHAKSFECPTCKRTESVRTYVPDAERLMGEIAHVMKDNQALAKLRAEGAACPKCGGTNAVPDDGSVQFVCKFCGGAILLSELVSADAVARARLKHGLADVRAAAALAGKKRDRLILTVVGVSLLFALALVLVLKLHGREEAPPPPTHPAHGRSPGR